MSSGDYEEKMERPLFVMEEQKDVVVLRFTEREGLAGTNLGLINELWSFFEQRKRRAQGVEPPEIEPPKVLVLDMPQGLLSARNVDVFWKEVGVAIPPATEEAAGKGLKHDSTGEITREENAFHRFIGYVQGLRSFVICVLRGDIAFPFLGLALSCDYRVVSDDTVFVNRCLDSGLPAWGATPWFLAHYVGQGKASKILLEEETIPAKDALDLGLVDCVASGSDLGQKYIAVAKGFANKPTRGLFAMKRSLIAARESLDGYLDQEEGIIKRFSSGVL